MTLIRDQMSGGATGEPAAQDFISIDVQRADRLTKRHAADGFSQQFSNAELANFTARLGRRRQRDGVGDNQLIQ